MAGLAHRGSVSERGYSEAENAGDAGIPNVSRRERFPLFFFIKTDVKNVSYDGIIICIKMLV